MYSVSFGAKLVQNKIVYRREPSGKYLPEKLSVAEINTDDFKDVLFLKTYAEIAGDYSYAECLFSDAVMNLKVKLGVVTQKILFLTSQKDDFENMSTDGVKGFISYYKYPNDEIRVNYLEGLQNSFFNNKNREYKHIGKALFSSMLDLDKPKKVTLHSTSFAKPFYLGLGLKENPQADSDYEMILLA